MDLVSQVFNSNDADRSGFLEQAEMRSAFNQIVTTIFKDRNFSEQRFKTFWERNDVNGDGKVSLAELFQEIYEELNELDRIKVGEPGMHVA